MIGATTTSDRAGCCCATLADRDLGLNPPAICRRSFSGYNDVEDVEDVEDVDLATQAVAQIAEPVIRRPRASTLSPR